MERQIDGAGEGARVVRTWRQIAAVLATRGGTPISPEQVKHVCRSAEVKLARALLADPDVSELFSPREVRGAFRSQGRKRRPSRVGRQVFRTAYKWSLS